jgi:acetyl esterase/lipase
VAGGLTSDESWCRQATQKLGIIVVDVDYRLAPEYPFPAQVHDAWAALKWVVSSASTIGIDKSRISTGGLSAGGHLAAVVAIMVRDDPEMPALKLQLLVVPAVDARYAPLDGSCEKGVCPYESYYSCEYAPCLPLSRVRWCSRLWIGTDPSKSYSSSALCWLIN